MKATLAIFVLCGCGAEADFSRVSSQRVAAGLLSGAVEYHGDWVGPLEVALFSSFPPVSAPVVFVSFDEPSYPQPYTVENLPTGAYYVLAVVDVDPTDGDRYHPSLDPGGAFGSYRQPASVTLAATHGAGGVDIELVDPSPTSPWSRPR